MQTGVRDTSMRQALHSSSLLAGGGEDFTSCDVDTLLGTVRTAAITQRFRQASYQ